MAMLLKKRYDVILDKSYAKILYLSSACQDTFCFLAMRSSRKNVFVHIDQKGKTLFELEFAGPVNSFVMVRQDQCILLQTKKDCITVINLNGYKIEHHKHQFIHQSSAFSELISFPESKNICIKEKGSPKQPKLCLSYYNSKTFELICAGNCKTYPFLVQANHRSAFASFENNQISQKFNFNVIQLKQNQIKQSNYVVSTFTFGRGKLQLSVSNIWQSSKNFFCIAGYEIKTDSNSKLDNIKRFIMIFQALTGMIRPLNLDHSAFQNGFSLDYYNLGKYFMAKSVDFIQGQPIQSPILYISNETEQLILAEQQICCSLRKSFCPGFDGSMMCQSIYQNYEVEEFTMTLKKVVKLKELILHFLLEVNPEFDEDLLQDVVQMIDYP